MYVFNGMYRSCVAMLIKHNNDKIAKTGNIMVSDNRTTFLCILS